MSNTSKIIVTIGIIFVFFMLFGLLTAAREGSENSISGVFGIILFIGLIAGLREVWKKPIKDSNTDIHKLNKDDD